MKNLLLLGDSIRVGYCEFVKDMLKDEAGVFFPPENCRFAQYTLRELDHWIKPMPEIDVIHWNNGLWDCLHLGIDGIADDGEAAGITVKPPQVKNSYRYEKEPLTPPDIYEYMLNRIVIRLKQLCPHAVIVFGTTTPVIEEEAPAVFRSNAEIDQYNSIARKVMQKYDIRINELGEYAKTLGKEYRRDWVHYNEIGCKLLAEEIITYLKNGKLI